MIQSIEACGTFDTETTQDVTRPKRTQATHEKVYTMG